MKKFSDILLTIFSYGIVVCLFAGGVSMLLYIIALFIGGEAATNHCTFTFKSYLPWVIKFTSVFTGFGLIGMYFSKQSALTVKADNMLDADEI